MGKGSDDLPHGHYIVPFSQAVRFHGHICPGLAVGYYASHLAMRWLSSERSRDEEVVAVLDGNGCGADAVQAITGCTVGKGNLIIHDNGKHVYTFVIRRRGVAVRIALRPEYAVDQLDPGLIELSGKVSAGKASNDEVEDLRFRIERVCRAILESPGERVFDVRHVTVHLHGDHRMSATIVCSKCGEPVSVMKAKKHDDEYLCPPCHKAK